MKIIDNNAEKRISCEYCDSILEVSPLDYINVSTTMYRCACCGKHIIGKLPHRREDGKETNLGG
jgi:DNA-directed RNA polymerase subunit RPC12/RpoP